MKTMKKMMAGFTLVELMIVVVILGILAAVAIPAFSRYVKRSKTSEATENLSAIYTAEVTYYQRSAETPGASAVGSQFIACDVSPASIPVANRLAGVWTTGNWQLVGFSTDKNVYYQYQVTAASTGSAAVATIFARGDLDGNTTTSTFSRRLFVLNGEVTGDTITIVNELE